MDAYTLFIARAYEYSLARGVSFDNAIEILAMEDITALPKVA